MLVKNKKIILVILSTLLLGGLATGYYFYNKGPVDVRTARGISVISNDLYKIYTTDTITAGKKFTGKVVEVTGSVKEISSNNHGGKLILLNTGMADAHINCTMEEDPGEIQPGQTITLKGIAEGIGQGDADLGIPGDVYLSRCYPVKH